MNGDTTVMRKRAGQLREQGTDVRMLADRLMAQVGSAQGGVTAAEVAATLVSDAFSVDQVVTAGAPGSHVHVIPEATRMLSLEDRADPVALLGSLINAGVANRMTVVFDGGTESGRSSYVVGGRAADDTAHPELKAKIARITELGYLAG